jgi:molybdopterin converting factor small subunit
VDVVVDGAVVAVLRDGSGADTVADPTTPLVTGDAVAFLPRAVPAR